MDKKILIILAIYFSVFLAGCENKKVVQSDTDSSKTQVETKKEQSNSQDNTIQTGNNRSQEITAETYQVNKNVYKDKNITINYPQITALGDNDKQTKINELIKKEALAIIYQITGNNLTININYDIALKNSNLLSIKYSGYRNHDGLAYPSNEFYTTNIDIKDEKILRLPDIVNIDENLVKEFKNGSYIDWQATNNSKNNVEKQKEVDIYINNIETKSLIEYLNRADFFDVKVNIINAFSYLTENSIVISINVPHAIGDHAEYEIKYKDIQDSIKINNGL